MRTVCEINKCNGCMACVDRCPKKCIDVKDEVAFLNAIIDEKQCIDCNLCKKVCPNITVPDMKHPIAWWQGWADTNLRECATSGGAASAIIKTFISEGGYVASCLFKNSSFEFDITNDYSVAKKFAGSKYVKSNPANIYKKIRDKLKTDKVLFVGLPCQVAALKSYVGNVDNLYTIDLICHGTPSSKILNKYLEETGNDIKRIKDISFRCKNDMGLHIDGVKLTLPHVADEYICTFLSAINYTENCYSCQFATINRVSDVTLGDSWGSELQDEVKKGISLILCQNEKGKELLDVAGLCLHNVDLDNAVKNNHQLKHPSVQTTSRDKFMRYVLAGKTYKAAAFRCIPKMLIKQKIKYVLIKSKLMH